MKIGESRHLGFTLRWFVIQIMDAENKGRQQDLLGKCEEGIWTYLTNKDALEQLEGARAKGWTCWPICDNVDEHGECLGHKE